MSLTKLGILFTLLGPCCKHSESLALHIQIAVPIATHDGGGNGRTRGDGSDLRGTRQCRTSCGNPTRRLLGHGDGDYGRDWRRNHYGLGNTQRNKTWIVAVKVVDRVPNERPYAPDDSSRGLVPPS
jgi:hypothetical protein